MEKHLYEEKIKAAYRDAKQMAEIFLPPELRQGGDAMALLGGEMAPPPSEEIASPPSEEIKE